MHKMLFFEYRLADCVKLCNTILAASPKETDVHEIKVSSLMGLSQLTDSLTATNEWAKCCGTNKRQLLLTLEIAYFLGQIDSVIQAAKALFTCEEEVHIYDVILAITLVVDLGKTEEAKELFQAAQVTPEDLMPVQIISKWAELKFNNPDAIQQLENLSTILTQKIEVGDTNTTEREDLGLALALLALNALEHKDIDKTNFYLKEAYDRLHGLKLDSLLAVQYLLKTFMGEVVQKLPFSKAHLLIRKRIKNGLEIK